MTAASYGMFRLSAIMGYFEEAASFGNLYKGMKKSCRNVRWKDSVIGYEYNGIKNTLSLVEDLKNDTYEIRPYQEFVIYEPKKRVIVATRIRDRQFQRSLCEAGLYEDVTEHLIRDNPACQKNKGTDDAFRRIKVHMRRFYNKHGNDGWALKCDIHHYFAETSHEVAKNTVRKYISDKRAAEAVCDIIDSFESDKGIGLGSQISQLVELLVLNDLDHFIKERLRVKHYIRYMDDFILIHEDKEYLKYCRQKIEEELEKIQLRLNRKTSLFPLKHGIWFMKWKFVYTDTGKILMLYDKKKIYRQRRRLKKLLAMEETGRVKNGAAQESLTCWLANAERGNTYRICEEMKEYFRKLQEEQNG